MPFLLETTRYLILRKVYKGKAETALIILMHEMHTNILTCRYTIIELLYNTIVGTQEFEVWHKQFESELVQYSLQLY